ncbi:hypothetical protein GCM10027422_39290 [Hymenobacter arcticus]
MPTALDTAFNAPQTAKGKGVVGEPKHEPGLTGVEVRAAIFFDGTLNNRTNSKRRLDKLTTIQPKTKKDDSSSYANFYSNVAIMELLNLKRDSGQHQVSVYVEGIGTRNFEKGAKVKQADGSYKAVSDADNGNDDLFGYSIGSGPTGIVAKVTKGIALLKGEKSATNPQKNTGIFGAYDDTLEYVSKIIVDVVGFSRGAAAARHFVHRSYRLSESWAKQGPPKIVINFVGLYDTVSSFESWKGAVADILLQNGLPLAAAATLTPAALLGLGLNSDRIFGDDVLQLGLDMKGVPKKVVHLTAADEYRENFSLTNINTSLKAGVGVELTIPGVHSDVGGGYAERDPHNPKRSLNCERRRMHDAAEERHLIAEGWYTPGQIAYAPGYSGTITKRATSAKQVPLPMPLPFPPVWLPIPATAKYSRQFGWRDGVRYLTNEYQYVALFIMLGFATKEGKHKPSKHEEMEFESTDGADNGLYKVPPPLEPTCKWLNEQAIAFTGSNKREIIHFASTAQRNMVRNRYLHRSARLISEAVTELKVGMAGRLDSGRDGYERLVIPDDKRYEKPQDTVRRKTTETKDAAVKKVTEVKDATVKKVTELKDATVQKATDYTDAGIQKATELWDSAADTAAQLKQAAIDKAAAARKVLSDQLQKLRNLW